MTQGSGMLYNLSDVTAITAQSAVYNRKKEEQKQKRREKKANGDFAAVYDVELMRSQPEDDVEIQTSGYTKTGAATFMHLRQHDYTFQTKTS